MKYSEVTEFDKDVICSLYDDSWIPEDIEDEIGIPLEGVYLALIERGKLSPENNPFNDGED